MANYDTSGLTYDSGVLYDAVVPPVTIKKRMSQVSLNLSQLNIAALLQKANNIKTAMTGNANFTTPNPTVTEIGTLITNATTANNTYETSLLTAKENLTLRDNAVDALVAGLNALAGYVQSQSGGDAAKIQSAGMEVKGARTPATIPDQVMNLSVTPGDNAGDLDLQWDPTSGATRYEIQTCADSNFTTGVVNQPSVSCSKTSIGGQTSGSRLWVRVRAGNAAGLGAWSDVATKIVP
jgi:hypothetical protein